MSISPHPPRRQQQQTDYLRLRFSLPTSPRPQGTQLAEELLAIDSPAVRVTSSPLAEGSGSEWVVTLTPPSGAATPELIRGWIADLLAAADGPHDCRVEGGEGYRDGHARPDAAGGPTRGDAAEDATSALSVRSQRDWVVASVLRRQPRSGEQRAAGRARLAR